MWVVNGSPGGSTQPPQRMLRTFMNALSKYVPDTDSWRTDPLTGAGRDTDSFRLPDNAIVESYVGSPPHTWMTVFDVPAPLEHQLPSPRMAEFTVLFRPARSPRGR